MNCIQRDEIAVQPSAARSASRCAIASRNTGKRQRRRRSRTAASCRAARRSPLRRPRRRSSAPAPCRRSGNCPDDPARSADASGRCRSSCLRGKSDCAPAPCRISDNCPARRSPRLRTSGRNIFCVRLAFLPRDSCRPIERHNESTRAASSAHCFRSRSFILLTIARRLVWSDDLPLYG